MKGRALAEDTCGACEIVMTTPRDGSLPQWQKHRETVKIEHRHDGPADYADSK